jgi:hypothetical protein
MLAPLMKIRKSVSGVPATYLLESKVKLPVTELPSWSLTSERVHVTGLASMVKAAKDHKKPAPIGN